MILPDRVWKAFIGTLIPVRVFMGCQMLLYGAAYFFVEKGHFYDSLLRHEGGFLWILGLGVGGVWMVASALCESWVRVKGLQVPHMVKLPRAAVFLSRSRFTCYFFAGVLWSSLTFNTWVDGIVRVLDFMGPLYVVFITWAAVNDAYQRRKIWLSRATPVFVLGK